MADLTYDIVVVGGSFGGCAAALSAARAGKTVCLIEATGWLGGQYTAQGVNRPDINRWVETVGSTATYREFEHNCRAYYRNNFRLSARGEAQPSFNPSGPYPGFAVDPKIGHRVLDQMLSNEHNVHLRMQTTIVDAELSDDSVVAVVAKSLDGSSTRYLAKYFLDATDLGELLPLAKVEFRLGAEAKADFNEDAAPAEARPGWIQPITVPIALEHRPAGETHTIPKPARYDEFAKTQHFTIIDGYISKVFTPGKDLWSYRQYIAAANFEDPAYPYDLTMLNMGSNDYQGGTLPTGDPAKDREIVEAARQVTLSYLYWLQTECSRDDGSGRGYPEIKPRVDAFDTPDGTAAAPYIREARRIKAIKTAVQQDIDAASNDGPRAALFRDSCGIGFYGGMDIHGLGAVDMPQQFINIRPFQISAASLVPERVTNVLASCKNLGVTHITNGAYRLHPVEWNVGESAGMLAAFCVTNEVTPRKVVSDGALLEQYQRMLLAEGVPLFWWTDVSYADAAFAAIHMMGVKGIFSGEAGQGLNFGPNDELPQEARAAIDERVGRALPWPPTAMTRGQAAQWLLTQIE